MRKSTNFFGWTAIFLAILAVAGDSCTKATSNVKTSAVTYLSVIHGAPYTSAVTVYLNDTLITQTTGIPTGAFSPKYGTIRPGFYGAKFKKAGTDSVLDLLSTSSYDTLNFYTLLLYNKAGSTAAHVLKIFDNFSTVTAANAYYRFFNLAPDFPKVNLYLNGSLVQSNRLTADNAVDSVYSSFRSLSPATYNISVRNAETDSVIATASGISLTAGNAYTIWVSGLKSPNNSPTSNNPISVNVLQAAY